MVTDGKAVVNDEKHATDKLFSRKPSEDSKKVEIKSAEQLTRRVEMWRDFIRRGKLRAIFFSLSLIYLMYYDWEIVNIS